MANMYFDYCGNIPDDDELMELLDAESAYEPSLGDPMEQLDVASDWHEDLHDEIEWMREMLLAEITEGYNLVCRLLSQSPDCDVSKDDKRFLEFALKFLTLTRDKKIKWSEKESFDIVRRIKSYVLHYRNKKDDEQFEKQDLQQKLSKEDLSKRMLACLVGPPSVFNVSSWCLRVQRRMRLDKRHDQICEEFQSLKREFLRIVSLAHRVYCELALKNEKRYLPLAWNFAYCMKFLRYSRSDLLLVSKDQFDYYVRKIRALVNGVHPTECVHINRSGDASRPTSSNSRVPIGVVSFDWHEALYEMIELTRKTDLHDIQKFYSAVCQKLETPLTDVEREELEKQRRFLEHAVDFLNLTRGDEIKLSKIQCSRIFTFIKMYALRSRNECLADQCEQQQQLKMGVWTDFINPSLVLASGSSDSTTPNEQVELADWHEDLHTEIESTREYLSDIEEIYRRVCSRGQESSAKLSTERLFLLSSLELLALTRNEKIIRPKNLCFRFLKQVKSYGMRCRNIINAGKTRDWLKEDQKYLEFKEMTLGK